MINFMPFDEHPFFCKIYIVALVILLSRLKLCKLSCPVKTTFPSAYLVEITAVKCKEADLYGDMSM